MSTYVMRKGKSRVQDLADGGLAGTLLWGTQGDMFYCDPTNGNDGNDGRTPGNAKASLKAAYDLTANNHNDVVIFIGGATADNPAAALTWSNSYTHLIGVSSPLPGVGQRCRVVTLAATAVTPTITFSGNGCIVKNVQFYNEKAAGSAAGCVIVTGLRNYFENVFFMSPVATDAASYSLKLGSAENAFVRCTIGQFTNPRTAASYGMWVHGAGNVSRNKFVECEFLSWGYDATHCHVRFDADLAAVPHVTWFENCLFHHNATQLTQAIDDNSTAAGHQIIFRGRNNLVVNAAAVGDVLTYMFAPNPDASISGLLAVTVAEA